MKMLWFVLCGAIVGVANIIPGVSGGTMAVILNIYDRLIETLSLKNLKKNLPFAIPLAIGAAAGIVLFSKAIKFLLAHFPMATNFAFIGLILGSIPMIFRRTKAQGKLQMRGAVSFLVALAVMLGLTILKSYTPEANGVMTTLTVVNFCILLAASAVSTFAMILPGISGSFVMLILGVYTTVLTAISGATSLPVTADNWQYILLLVPVAIGCVLGLVLGSRLVDVLMHRQPQATYCAILGLVVGSLAAVYVEAHFQWGAEGAVALVLMVAAAVAAYLFARTAKD